MEVHQGFPWLFDPAEKWHHRMRRRFAGLPDPEIPIAAVPPHLAPLWHFAMVADDLVLYLARCRGGALRALEEYMVQRRVAVFGALAAQGELARKLPYSAATREPGYVPDYQRGSEAQFI